MRLNGSLSMQGRNKPLQENLNSGVAAVSAP